MTVSTKRKLLFDRFSDDFTVNSFNGSLTRKIERLKQNKVKTVFIITSSEVVLESYMTLIAVYEENGFTVNSINIDALDDEHLLLIKNAVEEINASFRQGSCQIVSFGKSVAGPLLACFYEYSGRSSSLEESLEKVRAINESLIKSQEEIIFIHRFRRYLGLTGKDFDEEISNPERFIYSGAVKQEIVKEEIKKEPVAEKITEEKEPHQERVAQKIPDVAPSKKEIRKEKKDKSKDKDISYTDEEEYLIKPEDLKGFGRFYSSIRFKLVSITSVIVTVSLLGMIFLATYFFKKDNTTRIQENNLYVSEIVAIKVRSDFQAIMDKSILIANTMMQNKDRKELNEFAKILLNNDKDFIFFGIATPAKSSSKFNLVNAIHNDILMTENQITKNNVESVNRENYKVFNDSFNGDVFVQNISQSLQAPAVGISMPFHKDLNGRVQSILICHIKLDRFLQAFQSSGITKTFMVNINGDILAHSDNSIILGGGNYIDLPIVKLMLTNDFPNGQKRYSDEKGMYYLGSFNKISIGGIGIIATVEENIALQEVYNQQRRDIYLTIIVLTIVILIIFFFGKSLTKPIIRLLGATKKIKNGDYNVTIRPSAKDEIGELTNAFTEMAKGLEEREKIKTAFGKFVNPEIADMLTKDEVKLGGERKTVTVMFSDIRNFTSISEKLLPEEVVEFLNVYMSKMVDCVDRTGGIVDKFIGDAIMAEWGVPISRGNDTENAINSTLMMRKVLHEFNNDRGGDKTPLIQIGCGLNTGSVLAGQIGSEDRMEYTVIGDAVNLASRIEALNKPFGTDILISQDTYEQIKDFFAVEPMTPIKVKGKEEPQQIYAVLGRLDDPERPKNIKELRDFLGTKEQPFRRRREDVEKDSNTENINIPEEEVKYEILT